MLPENRVAMSWNIDESNNTHVSAGESMGAGFSIIAGVFRAGVTDRRKYHAKCTHEPTE